jgi:hypothetical protein
VRTIRFYLDADQAASKATPKQRLATLRMLFDWLITGQIIEVNGRTDI